MADYDPTQKTELFEPKNAEQYLLWSRPEIMRVLRDLAKKPEIITAWFDGGGRYFLTAVLGVLPEQGLVVFDCASDERTNELALNAERLVCVTRQDHITVRFSVSGLQKARFQGRSALAAPLPESVYRPQRREYFRVVTPTVNPLRVHIPQEQGEWLLPVVDLSCGGVGIYDPRNEFPAEPGHAFRDCRLDLPGFGQIGFNLQVRNIIQVRQLEGVAIKRIGCQFEGLAIDANALLQRYLHKLQLEAKQRTPD
jgi:c-di-GMP-binding flagellar brake protein YcgR